MQRLIVIFCIILFALIPTASNPSVNAQNETSAPYIYYYSDILNAFVIERADGSDARLFGADIIPEGQAGVYGPGWSPSGEWLAWRTWNGHSRVPRYRPFALNVDGTRHLTALDDYLTAELAWSPTADLLAVTGLVGEVEMDTENGVGTVTIRTMLIDAATESVLFTTDIPDYNIRYDLVDGQPSIEHFWGLHVNWMADGQHFLFAYALGPYDFGDIELAEGLEIVYQIFDQTGNMHQITQPAAEIIDETSRVESGLINGKIAYAPAMNPATIVVHDLITDQSEAIAIDNLDIDSVAFSPNAEAALFFAQDVSCESACPYSVWLWRKGETTLTLSFEDADWPQFPTPKLWSPDGTHAIIPSQDFIPLLLDLASGTVAAIDSVVAAEFWQWQGPGRVLLATSGDEGTVYSVNVATNTLEHTFTRRQASGIDEIGQFSPDGSAFAYIHENPVIQDVTTGAEIDVRPDGRSYFTIYQGEVYWSTDGEWLLVAEDGTIAGSTAPRWTSIVKRDGSMRRELGRHGSPAAFGWLPENVDLSKLPAPQSRPIFPMPSHVLHAADWSFIVSWSPDGTQLVRGAVNIGGVFGPSTLFDVETGQAIAELDGMDSELNTVEWAQNEDGSYSPQIIEHTIEAWQGGGWIFGASPDGSRLGVFGDGTLSIVDAETQAVLYSQDRLAIAAFSFTPDNSLLAITNPYSPTQILDGNTWEVLVTLNTHATAVAFSPDGQTLAIANSWDIELYDVDDLMVFTD